jgi:SAM-dependent methyltransferase
MTEFGDTWKSKDVRFWDGMWAKHCGSPMTEAILAEVAKAESVVEIGCGAGHLIHQAVERGWKGEYLGIDISQAALSRARDGWKAAVPVDFVCGDFMDLACKRPPWEADLVISRGVLQHQVHWMPMVATAMRFAPRVVMGVGYTTDREDRHLGGWDPLGHYDVLVSLPRLRAESAASGAPLESITKCINKRRPGHQEALVIFQR